MKTYKEVNTIKLQVDITICNKCGKHIQHTLEECWVRFEDFSIMWGYGSKNDMETWEFDLCEDCILEFISTFKHIPKIYTTQWVI